MTDHEADIATLHQEATQLRARIKRYEAALREIKGLIGGEFSDMQDVLIECIEEIAVTALQESSQ